MNWYKISQLVTETEQSEHYLGGPTVNIRPYEPIIQEAVNELGNESPGIFDNITDINVDFGYGQFGSVGSQSPNSINLNIEKLKSEVTTALGRSFSAQDQESINMIKHFVKQTIMHEIGHVLDEEIDETGNISFPGGEQVVEKMQQDWAQANPL